MFAHHTWFGSARTTTSGGSSHRSRALARSFRSAPFAFDQIRFGAIGLCEDNINSQQQDNMMVNNKSSKQWRITQKVSKKTFIVVVAATLLGVLLVR